MRRLLSILWQILKAFGGYLLYVAVILAIATTIEFLGSFGSMRRLGGALFQIFGSWLLVTGAHWIGKYFGNREMVRRVSAGDTSGNVSTRGKIWLEVRVAFGVVGFVAVFGWLAAGENGLLPLLESASPFHFLVAAIVVTLPALIGADKEIKRWLKGIKRLNALQAAKPGKRPEYYEMAIVMELDRFPESRSGWRNDLP